MSCARAVPSRRTANFTAGPAQLPDCVLQEAANAMIDVTGDGNQISIAELGHRTPAYERIHNAVIDDLISLLEIPDSHSVLLMSGGGSMQFSAVPLNLLPVQGAVADYIVTGSWSKKAAAEASKYANVNVIFDGKNSSYTSVPQKFDVSPNAAYLYYCANETIDGNEFHWIPQCPSHIPLVGDFSSTFVSRPMPSSRDFAKFGVIFAGVQKNLGAPGVTIVIVRNDLIGKALPITPLMCDYNTFFTSKSLYNTPPTVSIYIVGRTLKWIKSLGGLEALEKLNQEKSQILYEAIDSSRLFTCPVDSFCRSRMTIVFKFVDSKSDLLKAFLSEAEASGLIGLAGHRSVGGLRAALFNAQLLENVNKLVAFLKDFEKRHIS